MLTIQRDVYSPFLRSLAHTIAAAADAKKPTDQTVRDAVELLRSWNGQVELGLSAPMIAALTYQQLRLALVNRLGVKNVAYEAPFAYAVVDRLTREQPKQWFSDWNAEILAALGKALEGRTPSAGARCRPMGLWRLHVA